MSPPPYGSGKARVQRSATNIVHLLGSVLPIAALRRRLPLPPGRKTGALRQMFDRADHNVEVDGEPRRLLQDLFYLMIETSWVRLLGLYLLLFAAIVLVFALLYWLDPDALGGSSPAVPGRFGRALAFSVQSLVSIGVSSIYPVSLYGHAVATLEAFTGLIVLALSTGLAYARFARPTSRLLFARVATVANTDAGPRLAMRLINQRDNLILDARARAFALRRGLDAAGKPSWSFLDLPLTRPEVPVLAISWTLVHPIDNDSPLAGLDAEGIEASGIEILLVVSGTDESMAQPIHARMVYEAQDLRWNARFVDIISAPATRGRRLRYTRFHDVEPVA